MIQRKPDYIVEIRNYLNTLCENVLQHQEVM